MTAAIRRARPDDWPRIEALIHTAALPLEGAREAFQRGFVADREGEIVGVVALEVFADGALLRSLAVGAASRGEGENPRPLT
jgi:N-acetylglutamate synthase-like GNAT family acetyltransferase